MCSSRQIPYSVRHNSLYIYYICMLFCLRKVPFDNCFEVHDNQCVPVDKSHIQSDIMRMQVNVGLVKFISSFYLSTAVFILVAITHSSLQAARTVTIISWSFSIAFLISSPIASSGHFKSSLISPESSMRERKSSLTPISW